MSQVMIIYHAGCTDGWCGAWIFDRLFNGVDLRPARHGDDPPIVDGRTVFVVDFSYPREVMIEMSQYAHRLEVLDHHKTAEEECRDLSFCHFDSSKSGAMLAYDWCAFNGYLENFIGSGGKNKRDIASGMYHLAKYVQDRDLWTFKLPNSRYINSCINSYDHDLDQWDMLARRAAVTPESLTIEGMAIDRYRMQAVDRHVNRAFSVNVEDYIFPCVECTCTEIVSDLLNKLSVGYPMAASYSMHKGVAKVSLRSQKDGEDVGAFAKLFGGGGHQNSAGFEMYWDIFATKFLGISNDAPVEGEG